MKLARQRFYEAVGRQLREALAAKGQTTRWLAKQMGLKEPTVKRDLSGRSLDCWQLRNYCVVLDLPLKQAYMAGERAIYQQES